MDRYYRLFNSCPLLGPKIFKRNVNLRYVRKTPQQFKTLTRNIELALEHFDGHYSRVYRNQWPSIRLGLLSPRKYCAILNSFVDNHDIPENAIDLQHFYAKRLKFLNKAAERENATLADTEPAQIEPNQISSVDEDQDEDEEEIREDENLADDSYGNDSGSGDDLINLFKETSIDDEDRPFYNQASANVSLNDYVPTSELIFHEDLPADPIYYDGTIRDVDKNIQIIDHPPLVHQENLKILTFPRSDWSRFEPPSMVPKADLFSYYLLDGASILPVLVLEPRFDDICADYCAAPGGKSIALMMTLKPKYLLCNDSSQARLQRLHSIIKQYIPEISYVKSTLKFSNKDARKLDYQDTFDKIIVDVPCSNDRHSTESIENNIFKRMRTEERLSLPSTQCDILKSALRSLRAGGDVVYSTCTLSPLENDNVVKRALLQLREEGFPATYAIMDLRQALRPFARLVTISRKFVYGQQVVPSVCSNFGPMYISKIRRIS